MSIKAPKHDRLCRFNLEILPRIKEEIRIESRRTGLSMTQVMMKAWLIYKLVRAEDIYRYTSDGEWWKLEIL